jgi:hypothetical protein
MNTSPQHFCAYTVSKFALHQTNPVVYVREDLWTNFSSFNGAKHCMHFRTRFRDFAFNLRRAGNFLIKEKFVNVALNLLLAKILNAAVIAMRLGNLLP